MPRTLGIEIEMPVASRASGASHKVGTFFNALAAIKQARSIPAQMERMQGRPVAVHSPQCVSGLDNAYNNLESALGPYAGAHALHELHAALQQELADVAQALRAEPHGGAMAVNFSEHPCVQITPEYYQWIRPPKPIYEYWVQERGWQHMAGVDAKAHNGPTAGVPPSDAVLCLNVLLASSACFIALYANSPFEACKPAGYKENRLTLWPRMFSRARYACDRKLHHFPARPFRGWGDYFRWMFGPGTCMQFAPPAPQDAGHDTRNYKAPAGICIPDGAPSLLEYLHAPEWPARMMHDNSRVTLHPCLEHLEFLQFSQFLDARLRFAMRPGATLQEFLARLDACHLRCEAENAAHSEDGWQHGCPSSGETDFCDSFASLLQYAYLEGRAPGANLPDRELAGLDDGDIAASVASSASALQLGLLERLEEARLLLARHPWHLLGELREAAIRHGMQAECQGLSVSRLSHELLELATDGLAPADRWLLAYPRHVLRTGKSGADRALEAYERLNGSPETRLLRLVQQRALVL